MSIKKNKKKPFQLIVHIICISWIKLGRCHRLIIILPRSYGGYSSSTPISNAISYPARKTIPILPGRRNPSSALVAVDRSFEVYVNPSLPRMSSSRHEKDKAVNVQVLLRCRYGKYPLPFLPPPSILGLGFPFLSDLELFLWRSSVPL